MNSLTLAIAPHSADSVAAEIYCRKASLQIRRVVVSPMTGAHRNRILPYLEDQGGNAVAQGKHHVLKLLGARFLAQSDGVKRIWYPEQSDPALRDKIDGVLDLVHELDVQIKIYVYYEGIVALNANESDAERPFHVLQAKGEVNRLMMLLDGLLPENAFFAGLLPSIADLSLICSMLRLTLVSFSFAPFKRIANWMKIIIKELSPHFYELAEPFGFQKDVTTFGPVHPLIQFAKGGMNVKKYADCDFELLEEEKFDHLLVLLKESQNWQDFNSEPFLNCKLRNTSPSELLCAFSL
jgi:glutathione S-transferase